MPFDPSKSFTVVEEPAETKAGGFDPSKPFTVVQEGDTPSGRAFAPPPGTSAGSAAAPLRPPTQAFPTEQTQAEAISRIPALSAAEAEELAMTPQLRVPQSVKKVLGDIVAAGVPGGQLGPVRAAIQGPVNTAAGGLEFLTAPGAGPLMAAQAVPYLNTVIDTTLAASLTKSGAQKLGEATVTGDLTKATEGVSEMVMGGLSGMGAGRSAMPEKPEVKPPPILKRAEAELQAMPTERTANAIQERSATEVPVEAPPGDSAKVGERVPEPKTSPVPQDTGQHVDQPQAKEAVLGDVTRSRKGAAVREQQMAAADQAEGWIIAAQKAASETPLGKASPDAALKVVSEWIRKGETPRGPIPPQVLDSLMRSLGATRDLETGETLSIGHPDWPRTGTLIDFLEKRQQERMPDVSTKEPGKEAIPSEAKTQEETKGLLTNKPAPSSPEQATQAESPTAGMVSAAEASGAATPESPPAKISEATTKLSQAQPEIAAAKRPEAATAPMEQAAEISQRLAEIQLELKDLRKGYVTGQIKRQMEAPLKDEQTRLLARLQALSGREAIPSKIKIETGPGIVDLGAATPASIPGKAPSPLRHWWDVHFGKPLSRVAPTVKAIYQGREIRAGMARLRDWVDNGAKLFGRSVANDVRQPLKREFGKQFGLADNALSFVVEAKGNAENLGVMRQKILDSKVADPWWRKQAIDALDFATYNWDRLKATAKRFVEILNEQLTTENNSGIPTLKREGYVPHRQDIPEGDFLTRIGQGDSTFFRKVRQHETFADSIAAGVDPKTLSATDLLENRLSSGSKLVNSRAWLNELRGWTDPTTKQPIATNLQPVKRADGSIYMEAPPGYVKESIGPHDVAIHKGYEGTFKALTDPSAFTQSMVGRGFLQANAAGKSINLMIDTFHLGRLAFWESLIKGAGLTTFKTPLPSFKRGVTLMDFTPEQIVEMAKNGEIPKKWVGTMLEDQRRLGLGVKAGYNVGRVSDALYQDVIHSLPAFGTFNKWLFDKFQRGAMAEAYLLEFERLKRADPEMPDEAVAQKISKDLNTRFGNLGRQGIFKSQTARDTARTLFLAPQWNEGLIRSELGAISQAKDFVMDAATGKRIYAGVLLRSVGGMAVAQFVANQIINQATRGKFTWENPEEGWGSKLSAWIPDFAGNGPGFFLHPLGLAAETTHLLTNMYDRSGGDTSKVALDYARSRASAAMRPVLTFLTRTDFLGRHLKPGTLWGEILKSAVPVPIAGGAGYALGKQVVTGQPSESFPGQFQKQAMSSVGIKTEGAPSPEQRIQRLAAEFKREQGVAPNIAFLGTGEYEEVTKALRMGNMKAAEAEMDKLRDKHTPTEIRKHFDRWKKAPFTGSLAREREFRGGLSAEQQDTYDRAREERQRIANLAGSLF